MYCIDASHASFKYLAGQRNKGNENHYPSDDETEVVTEDRSMPAKQNWHILLL